MTLAERLVKGETLEGDDAREVLDTLFMDHWILWVKLAAVYVRLKQYDQVLWILDQLVDREENKV